MNSSELKLILPLGMIFQSLFTVAGGGMLIAGIIAGISSGFQMTGEEAIGKICLLLIIAGGVLLFIGIMIAIFLYKAVKDSKE